MVLADKDPEKDKTQTAAGVPEKKWAVGSVRCSVFGEASRGREPTGARVLRVWGW